MGVQPAGRRESVPLFPDKELWCPSPGNGMIRMQGLNLKWKNLCGFVTIAGDEQNS
jgi:hypothetical protein